MIPQQITLEGFLSYKACESIPFDDAELWMLTGPNGSGKSTIFDAVTFAVFGQHRGGGSDAHELINKECDKACVEFEFSLGPERFVARRTVQRTKLGKAKGSQQLYRVSANGTQEPVEGTHLKAGYEEWITHNIGLSYEVFTSSVLLLQGKAEKLLDAGPKGRFDVLAGIVDLERYERLHVLADEARKKLKNDFESLCDQLEALQVVTPLELAEASANIETAETEQQQARREVERLQTLGFQSQNWVALQGRVEVARQRYRQARKLLEEAATIEEDVKRLGELRDVLPRLETLVAQRGQIQESEAKSQELDNRAQKLGEQLTLLDNNLGQTRKKIESLRKLIQTDEQRHREVAAALRQAGALLEKLKEYERHENDLNAIRRDLARMPPDPKAALQQAREKLDALSELAQAVPILARFQTQRELLREARTRERSASETRDATQLRGTQLRADVGAFQPKVQTAVVVSQQADAQKTSAETLLVQAQQQRDDLARLDGAKICRQCGQKLTASHLREETARRDKEAAAALDVLKRAVAAQEAARREEHQARTRLTELEAKLAEARESFKEQRAQADEAHRAVERLNAECGQCWSDFAPSFQQRLAATPLADWAETTFPSATDLADLRQQANELKNARRRLSDAEKIFTEWNTFKGLEGAARQNLARLEQELPAERQKVRGDHTRLEVEDKALDDSLKARRQELDAGQKDLTWLTEEHGKTEKQQAELAGLLTSEETTRQLCRQIVNRSLKDLPELWRAVAERAGMGELFRWRSERDQLVEKQTDERGKQLEQARVGFEVMQHDLKALEEEEQQFPPEARQEPEQVAGQLRLAQQTAHAKLDALGEAKQRRNNLNELRQRRDELRERIDETNGELKYAELLAKLLGRDRLQLHLIRHAERQVIDHANAVLDRLSGGQLYLRLMGQADGDASTSKALELEAHNRTTADRPINVAFLSGSQKFRVAVSLALGLGQYASRQHRPIESVIIDEGFGCLDKEGRQAMIQELQNLRGQLRCILLVSHQEEFADAFADGYRFELAGGSTKVTRFQR
jgi:exonuclease SbcC